MLSTGTEAPDPGGRGRLPVCGGGGDRPCDLRVGLGHARAEPPPGGVAGEHAVRAGAPRRRGQAPGAAQHLGELHDR